jgi:hypothetical protein
MSEIKVNSIKGVGASTAAITVNNTDGTCTANITSVNGGQLGNRNKIINGAMQVSQRGTSDSGITSSEYADGPDRYKLGGSSFGTVTVSQSTDSPNDFANSYKVDVTTANGSLSAGSLLEIQQSLEGQDVQDFAKGTSDAKQYALSFHVKSTKNGTYVVMLFDHDNNRMVCKTYTVSDANWNKYTLIFPADTTGAFGNDNAKSLSVKFILVAGTTFTSGTLQTTWGSSSNANSRVGQVNFADSTSNEWYLTGVQLEVGSVATEFEHKSFNQELALCKRYYQQFPQSPADAYGPIASGRIRNSTNAHLIVFFPEMRSSPTVTKSGNLRILHADTSSGVNSVASSHMARNIIFIEGIVSSGLTMGQGCIMTANNDSSGKITLSAEL